MADVSPANASISYCPDIHCYALATYSPSFELGNISGHILFNPIADTVKDPAQTSMITEEMWMNTNPSGTEWVETGVTTGYTDVMNGPNYVWITDGWFFASSPKPDNGGAGYSEVYLNEPTNPGTIYSAGLHYHGGGVWNAQRSDQPGATWYISSGNPNSPGRGAQAGSETSMETGVSLCGSIDLLAYQVSGSTQQIFGWPNAKLTSESTSHIKWTSTYNDVQLSTNTSCSLN